MFWNLYDDLVYRVVSDYIPELSKYEREAIWLQTRNGEYWTCTEPEEREEYPVFEGDIIDFLVHEYVYAEAGRWSNARIREYLGE
jgi:hypothetical protein